MDKSDQISIGLCSDEDIPEFVATMSRGFGHDAPFLNAYFPDHDTEHGHIKGCERMLAWKNAGSASTFIKAVLKNGTEEQHKIIGIAVWTHMKEAPSADLEKLENVRSVWPQADDAEYMKRLWRKYVVPRTHSVENSKGAGVYVLELLGVDKAYQRRGAGLALVKWGTDMADREGLTAVVEATPVGRRTYEKAGFRTEIERMDLDTGKEFLQRTKPKLIFMTRHEQ